MLERGFVGSRRYWGWIILLLAIIGIGFICYLEQWFIGLGITGMSRDVSWGLYIAQFTFLVGVAASALMVVLPYYLHNYKEFGKITILAEFLAVAAVVMCIMFILVDLGQPARMFNLVLYPSPASVLFWDMIVLSVYLLLSVVIAWVVLDAERKLEKPPAWIKPVIILSIIWAPLIHIVTAFIYSGLVARPFWLAALLAPHFLASAFASGPSLLILLLLILKKFTKFDAGTVAVQKLAQIVTYALITATFFWLAKLFVVLYSEIPKKMVHYEYLFLGIDGNVALVPWMWAFVILTIVALVLLINPNTRRRENVLALACGAVFVSIWIEKGLGLIVAGFIPSPLGEIFEYWPTLPEVLITLGIWAVGFLILTITYKITISVKEEIATY
ncbi:polysulfide reductase NrfD [Dehalococcoidales bacterium]|nr:polysulfide reductase NrfD [Dehalococcoidales bacterium]